MKEVHSKLLYEKGSSSNEKKFAYGGHTLFRRHTLFCDYRTVHVFLLKPSRLQTSSNPTKEGVSGIWRFKFDFPSFPLTN
jgi:hypothetical protein